MDYIQIGLHAVCSGSKEIALKGFKREKGEVPINLAHFCPINTWSKDIGYVQDRTTDDKYWNERKKLIRMKCLALVAATPFIQLIGQILNVANRIVKIVSLAHFWKKMDDSVTFRGRVRLFTADLLRVILAPVILVAMEISALYGLIRPRDGRKLYATLERASYSQFFLAPCFQPSPKVHLFGGSGPGAW